MQIDQIHWGLFITIAVTLAYAFDITIGDTCACDQITYQGDCNITPKCQWKSGACENVTCSSISTQYGCNFASHCAWVNNICSQFTKCSDYSSNANVSCDEYGTGCSRPTNGTACQDKTTNSSGAVNCSAYSPFNQSCNILVNICIYNGTACRNIQCSDYTNFSSCNYVLSPDITILKLCAWSGTACAESISLPSFNSTTCYVGTSLSYTWNPSSNKCVKCSSTQSSTSTSSTCTQCSSSSYMLLAGLLSVLIT